MLQRLDKLRPRNLISGCYDYARSLDCTPPAKVLNLRYSYGLSQADSRERLLQGGQNTVYLSASSFPAALREWDSSELS